MDKIEYETYVVLFDVETLDRKDHAEAIQCTFHHIFFASGCKYGARLPLIESIAKRLDVGLEGIDAMTLNDFMEAYNNEEINEVGTWMSYVNVAIETQRHRDAVNEEFKGFVIELNDLCDEWGYPHPDEEKQKEAYETYESVQDSDPNGSHVWVEDALYSIYDESNKIINQK